MPQPDQHRVALEARPAPGAAGQQQETPGRAIQPAMLRHPVVLFFPGEYVHELGGGSSLRLFGTLPSPTIYNPYYRATNLDHYKLAPAT